MKTKIYKLIVSAFVAGLLAALIAYNGGATLKSVIVCGVIVALKDIQAYLSSPPSSRSEPKDETT